MILKYKRAQQLILNREASILCSVFLFCKTSSEYFRHDFNKKENKDTRSASWQ